MAKNTKGDGSLEQNGVTTVTPDNMGKGLVWNKTTKQYDVSAKDSNGVKVNPDGSVGLALSPDAGNLIELRNNGIYYGVQAIQQEFYIDAMNGSDDSGNGMKESPYRTLNKVLSILPSQKRDLRIFLHENQTHICNLMQYNITSSFLIRPYGEQTDELWKRYRDVANGYKNQGGWQVYETTEFHQIAPKLVFNVVNKSYHGGREGASNTFIWLTGEDVRIDGISFAYADPQGFGIPANSQWRNLFGGQSGNIYFFDCHIDNTNAGAQWNLFSDHDGSVNFKVWGCTVTDKSKEIAHIGRKMVLEISGDNSYANRIIGDNLHKRTICTTPEVIAMITNKGEAPRVAYNNLEVNY